MSELRLLAAALLVFESANRTILHRDMKVNAGMGLWALAIAAVVAGGHVVFGPESRFLTVAAGLLLANLVRVRAGWLNADSSFFRRWLFVPAFTVYALTGDVLLSLVVGVVPALGRRSLRAGLMAMTGWSGPVRLSSLDVDTILPEPIRYDREPRERGLALMELMVGMTLLVVITTSLFVASVQRSARLRHVRESARTREAAVSALERASAVPFEELGKQDGVTFEVPGDGEPGTIRVEFPEEGLARIEVEAPRRGSTPIRIETLRTETLP